MQQRGQPQSKWWLPATNDVRIRFADGSTRPLSELQCGATKPTSLHKQIREFIVFTGDPPTFEGVSCLEKLRREVSGDHWVDSRPIRRMMFGRGFIIFVTTAMETAVYMGAVPSSIANLFDSFKVALNIALYADYTLGVFASGLFGVAITQCNDVLSYYLPSKQKEWHPVYLRSVKLQTLVLCVSVALIRTVTGDFIPWPDTDMQIAAKLGCQFQIAFHHMFAVGAGAA